MKLKDITTSIKNLIFLSSIPISGKVQTNKNNYWQRGSLKVDAVFKDNYLQNFLVPYIQFEDLHACKIRIKTKKLKTTMTARPGFASLFMGKKNRQYIIHVNTDEAFKGVLLANVPEEARIGLFAHELMHIRDYESRKVTGVLKRGLQYLSKNGKRNVEHYTDSLTISAGFGEQLFQWAAYVLYDSEASEDYKAFKSDIYMSPITIYNKMNRLDWNK
ncbi:hypothetical protein [Saccharicrinis fermentans]|uniref:Uncharacterized protein n=1 Tax=Saccharicrinis fermentans DSM 9555 = JCM 21142 TaxID=869213 RepID=W7Y662_9BACT|nr:hypothetical protein [Saccharicrinis fermentans]GAF03093.1 hypothetical protein JCM21142_41752 [Saccharicrinis fermentans DSM 9555 = JCM 21142]